MSMIFHKDCDPKKQRPSFKGPNKFEEKTCDGCDKEIMVGDSIVFYKEAGATEPTRSNVQSYRRYEPTERDPGAVRMPEDFADQLRVLCQRFSMDKSKREGSAARKTAELRKKGLTHLAILEIKHAAGEIPDEGWFARNQPLINSILANRGAPDAI